MAGRLARNPARTQPMQPLASGKSPAQLFTADGREIRDPDAYVATIERQGYTRPIFTATGKEIRDPVKYLSGGNAPGGRKRQAPSSEVRALKRPRGPEAPLRDGPALYMENGTPIKNPGAYVARIEANGYTKPLFSANGQEIRDPVAYVKKMEMNTNGGGGGSAENDGADGQLGQMYKSGGVLIRNPEKIVSAIEKHGYVETLYQANGAAIKDPVKFFMAHSGRAPIGGRGGGAGGGAGGGVRDGAKSAGDGQIGQMYKSGGELIRNPEKIVSAIEKNGYAEMLYQANGKAIKDPVKFFMAHSGRAQTATAPTTEKLRRGVSRVARAGKPRNANEDGDSKLFKANGEAIKNPGAYISKIAQNGYNEPLFNAVGEEIRDPVAYLKQLKTRVMQPNVAANGTISYYGKFARTAAGKRPPVQQKRKKGGGDGTTLNSILPLKKKAPVLAEE